MSIQARKANHDINPDFHSSNKNRATQPSSKSKGKSNFRSISQLMKTPPSNRNRYSFLQCSQHDDDDDNLQETYASVAARQNSNLHSTLSPGSITPGQRHQIRTQCKKLPKLNENEFSSDITDMEIEEAAEVHCNSKSNNKDKNSKNSKQKQQDKSLGFQKFLEILLPYNAPLSVTKYN